MITRDDTLSVLTRTKDVVIHATRNCEETNSLIHMIYIGGWSQCFSVPHFGISRIDFEVERIVRSLIPDFVESIDDAETWLIIGDYWEERGDDKAIACRKIAESLISETGV